MSPPRRSACLLVVALCLHGLVGCAGATAGVAEVIEWGADDVAGSARTAVVPTGTLEVTIGAPVRELPQSERSDVHDRSTAPKGSTFLPVHWEFDRGRTPLSGAGDRPQEADVSLLIGREGRVLGSPYTVDGRVVTAKPVTTFYVVVPGSPSPSDVVVQVAYDGADQRIDEQNRATGEGAGLAEDVNENFAVVPCPTTGWEVTGAAEVELICDDLEVATSRYWPGRGWAPGGQEWRVLWVRRLGVGMVNGTAYLAKDVTGNVSGQQLTGSGHPTSVDGMVALPMSEPVRLEIRTSGWTAGPGADPGPIVAHREVALPQ